MKNATVREFIEQLQKMNPNALVCRFVDDPDEPYSTVETVKEINNVPYIDDAGDIKTGDVVAIY